MKRELFVRFANESSYHKWISLDTTKIENPVTFPNEVFFTIDGVRVATIREDWDKLQKEMKENEKL